MIKRVIHATADFDYRDSLFFSPGAVAAGVEAMKAGAWLVTDTNMAKAGVNKAPFAALGDDTGAGGVAPQLLAFHHMDKPHRGGTWQRPE